MGRRHREGACVCVKVCACACIYLVPGVQSTEAAAGTHLRRPRPSQGEPDWLSETRDEHRGRTPQLISTCRPRRSGVDLGSSASRSRAFVRFLLRHPGAWRPCRELRGTCSLRYFLVRSRERAHRLRIRGAPSVWSAHPPVRASSNGLTHVGNMYQRDHKI